MIATSRIVLVLAVSSLHGLGQDAPATPPTSTVRIWVSNKEVASVQGEFPSADLLKQLDAKCVGVVLTDTMERADYRLEAGRAWCCTPRGESRGYKFALFNKDGDSVFATKTRQLSNAAKDMCKAIGRSKEK